MMELVDLTAGSARLVLVPALGGGIASLDVDNRSVLRPWSGDQTNPFSLALNILVPFSNRISGGGFDWNGQWCGIAPNLTGEPFPIHGDGFQKSWTLAARNVAAATLALDDGRIGPFSYAARQVFRLGEGGLNIDLTTTNTGNQSLPFGCGFHPWFPRDTDTRLSFAAEGVWMEDTDYLPTELAALADMPDWEFGEPRPLPAGWINNAYTGWNGSADIEQGAAFVSTRITASSMLDHAIVHSIGDGCAFFCFEPVSHAVDAVNRPGHPGMTILAPGQSMSACMRLDWSAT